MATVGRYARIEQVPTEAPVFPLSGALLLPRARLPLNIFEPRYLAMVDDALASERVIAMVQPEVPGAEAAETAPPLAGVGTAGRITDFRETGDGRYFIILTGIARFTLAAECEVTTPYRRVRMDFAGYEGDLRPAREPVTDRAELIRLLEGYLARNQLEVDWEALDTVSAEGLVNGLAMMLPLGSREKQALLLAASVQERAQLLASLLEMGGSGENFPLQ